MLMYINYFYSQVRSRRWVYLFWNFVVNFEQELACSFFLFVKLLVKFVIPLRRLHWRMSKYKSYFIKILVVLLLKFGILLYVAFVCKLQGVLTTGIFVFEFWRSLLQSNCRLLWWIETEMSNAALVSGV